MNITEITGTVVYSVLPDNIDQDNRWIEKCFWYGYIKFMKTSLPEPPTFEE